MDENTNQTPVAPVVPETPVAVPTQAPAPAAPAAAPAPQKPDFEAPQAQTASQEEVQKTPKVKEDPKTGKIIRYPFLLMTILILRMLGITCILLSVIVAFLQFFAGWGTLFFAVAMFFASLLLGLFLGFLCWVLSEGIKVWMDTEEMVRTPEKEAELRAVLAELKK